VHRDRKVSNPIANQSINQSDNQQGMRKTATNLLWYWRKLESSSSRTQTFRYRVQQSSS